MESNLTNKKPYNVMLMLAGISFALWALGEILSRVLYILPHFKYPYGTSKDFIVATIISSVFPIIFNILILVFCVFMFIGKPKVMFTIFFAVSTVYYILSTVGSVITMYSRISQFFQSLSYEGNGLYVYGYSIISEFIVLLSVLLMFVGFGVAFAISLTSFIKRKPSKLWFVPGIIIVVAFVFEVINNILSLFSQYIMEFMANAFGTSVSIYTRFDFANIAALILSIIASVLLVAGTFLLCKGNNR